MARITPLREEELPDSVKPVLEFARATMGFTPNDVLTMARWPEMLQAMAPRWRSRKRRGRRRIC